MHPPLRPMPSRAVPLAPEPPAHASAYPRMPVADGENRTAARTATASTYLSRLPCRQNDAHIVNGCCRSEEPREGETGIRTCRCRWSTLRSKQKTEKAENK